MQVASGPAYALVCGTQQANGAACRTSSPADAPAAAGADPGMGGTYPDPLQRQNTKEHRQRVAPSRQVRLVAMVPVPQNHYSVDLGRQLLGRGAPLPRYARQTRGGAAGSSGSDMGWRALVLIGCGGWGRRAPGPGTAHTSQKLHGLLGAARTRSSSSPANTFGLLCSLAGPVAPEHILECRTRLEFRSKAWLQRAGPSIYCGPASTGQCPMIGAWPCKRGRGITRDLPGRTACQTWCFQLRRHFTPQALPDPNFTLVLCARSSAAERG